MKSLSLRKEVCGNAMKPWILSYGLALIIAGQPTLGQPADDGVLPGTQPLAAEGLGNTFNYSEMAALIAPRPFMVERGHFDGVAPDEAVAYEYAKVRHLYAARLGIPERTEIEWFVGPHQIHGVGTFAFLRRHLAWPESQNQRGQ